MFHWLEKNPFFFTVVLFVVVGFAGVIEAVPNFAEKSRPVIGKKPYTMLQIAGRQVYIKENCLSCHSQLIRPFKNETDRYGNYSLSGEYAFDRPFLWGSKRTGPDLHRVGNYRTTQWHEQHMKNPPAIVPGSIMPKYTWQFEKNADLATAYDEAVTVMNVFGVPYNQGDNPKVPATFEEAKKMMLEEAKDIVKDMKDPRVKEALANGEVKEVVALIAYLNSLK